MKEKDFFINAIRMIDIDGAFNIPTVLFYDQKGKYHIGSSAIASAQNVYCVCGVRS